MVELIKIFGQFVTVVCNTTWTVVSASLFYHGFIVVQLLN